MKRKIYSWTPSYGHELLLKSALSESKEALLFWKEWINLYDINKADRGAYRLFPLVFNNLRDVISKEDRYYKVLKGIYRKSWFKNQMILEVSTGLFEQLRSKGIEVVLLKGIHLISSYYKDIALRPLGDADFLVPRSQAERVGEILKSSGWETILNYRYRMFSDNFMLFRKSAGYRNSSGYLCDLHWNIFRHLSYPCADIEAMESTVVVSLKGNYYKALGPEYLLLHLLEHGAYDNPVSSVRWIPDVLRVLGKEKGLDRDLFVAITKKSYLKLPVTAMLSYLNNTFLKNKLNKILEELDEIPECEVAVKLYRQMVMKETGIRRKMKEFYNFFLVYCIYRKDCFNEPFKTGFAQFVRFLKFRWGMNSNILLPFIFFEKFFRKLFRHLLREWRMNRK